MVIMVEKILNTSTGKVILTYLSVSSLLVANKPGIWLKRGGEKNDIGTNTITRDSRTDRTSRTSWSFSTLSTTLTFTTRATLSATWTVRVSWMSYSSVPSKILKL